MKINIFKYIFLTVFSMSSIPVMAGGAVEASAQAVTHSMEAIGYTLEGSFKLASGAVAVPFTVVGEIGKVSGEVGNELWEEANSPPHGPFPVTDEVITVGPKPSEQLENRD